MYNICDDNYGLLEKEVLNLQELVCVLNGNRDTNCAFCGNGLKSTNYVHKWIKQ